MSDKVLNFLRVVGAQFAKRHASPADERIWLDSMVKGLKDYQASVLDRAAQRIINTKTDPGFPYLAECRKACDEIIKLERAEKTPKFDDAAREKSRINGSDWQYRLADELIMSGPLGKRAAKEGWVLSLHDFCRNKGRLPLDHEVSKCIQDAKGFDEAYEAVLNGNGGALTKALEALGDTMLKRREALRAKVLGEAA